MKAGISLSFSKLHRVELGEKKTKKQLNVSVISRNSFSRMKFKTFLILCEMTLNYSGRMVGLSQIFLNL